MRERASADYIFNKKEGGLVLSYERIDEELSVSSSSVRSRDQLSRKRFTEKFVTLCL